MERVIEWTLTQLLDYFGVFKNFKKLEVSSLRVIHFQFTFHAISGQELANYQVTLHVNTFSACSDRRGRHCLNAISSRQRTP